jgi:DnaJ-domain-containing protein 1
MESLLDRFEKLVRSYLSPGGDRDPGPDQDPDFRDAWRELDEYLAGGGPRPRQAHPRPEGRTRRPASPRAGADEQLRRDYANLEIRPGSSLEEATRAYKTLLKRYHPDKFAADPEKQRLATEITQRINSSFRNIKEALAGKP